MIIHGIFILVLFPRSTAQCSGPYGDGCCAGYRKNSETGKCIACPTGFQGLNCTIPCRFPSFGENCQRFCQCSKQDCHNARGCILTIEHRTNETRESSTESEGPMIDVSIFLSAVAVVIICCYTGRKIFLKIFKRQISADIGEERGEPETEGQVDTINIPDYQSLREMSLGQIRGTSIIRSVQGTSSSDGSDFSYIDVDIKRSVRRYYQNTSTRHHKTNTEGIITEEGTETSQADIILTPPKLVYSNPSVGRLQYENQAEESYFILQPDSFSSRETQ